MASNAGNINYNSFDIDSTDTKIAVAGLCNDVAVCPATSSGIAKSIIEYWELTTITPIWYKAINPIGSVGWL